MYINQVVRHVVFMAYMYIYIYSWHTHVCVYIYMDWKCNFNSTDRQIHYNMFNTMILNDVFEVVKRNYYIHICKFLISRIDEDGQKKTKKVL